MTQLQELATERYYELLEIIREAKIRGIKEANLNHLIELLLCSQKIAGLNEKL